MDKPLMINILQFNDLALPSAIVKVTLSIEKEFNMAFVLKSQSSPLYILFPSGRLDLGNELESITDCSGLEKKMGLFAVLINKKYTKDGLELSFFIVARCTYPLDIKMQFKFVPMKVDELRKKFVQLMRSLRPMPKNSYFEMCLLRFWLPDFIAELLIEDFNELTDFFKLTSYVERYNKALELISSVDLNNQAVLDKIEADLRDYICDNHFGYYLFATSKLHSNFSSLLSMLKSPKAMDVTTKPAYKPIENPNDFPPLPPSDLFSGMFGSKTGEYSKLEKQIEDLNAAESVKNQLREKLKSTWQSHDSRIFKYQLEYIVSLPWGLQSEDNFSLAKLREELDRDHFGLEEIKKRIAEYFIVRHMSQGKAKAPILCLVGPAGVGKTSLAYSIAKSMNRKFFKISLAGVEDQAFLKGHRITYLGAIPGQIMNALKTTQVSNPVILLDEVDKIHGYRGRNVSSALLEILDPEQNAQFTDHFVNFSFDLSKVLFICTANDARSLSPYILDRMELIHMKRYKLEEKMVIAEKFLIPKKVTESGLANFVELSFTPEALKKVIRSHTLEAGVRGLTRVIENFCRHVAAQKYEELKLDEKVAEGVELAKVVEQKEKILVDVDFVENVLGNKKYDADAHKEVRHSGVAIGLCVNSIHGSTMIIEAVKTSGKGELITTGLIGRTLLESAKLAFSWFKRYHTAFGITDNEVAKYDVHVHYSNLDVKKNGPSATITTAIAILSLFTGKMVEPNLAMTGEMTLLGYVLGVGGIEDKLMAAYEQGITAVILPETNRNDAAKVGIVEQKLIQVHYAKTFEQVIEVAFGGRVPVLDYLRMIDSPMEKAKL